MSSTDISLNAVSFKGFVTGLSTNEHTTFQEVFSRA